MIHYECLNSEFMGQLKFEVSVLILIFTKIVNVSTILIWKLAADLNLLEILLEIVKLKRKIANLQIEIVKFRKY